jgi:hypothetical protein
MRKYCHVSVTIDGSWIDDSLTPWYSKWLHITVHYYKHTSVHSHVFTSCCLVSASNSGQSPSSGFPNSLRPQQPASNSNSSQWLKPSSFLTATANWSWLQHVSIGSAENVSSIIAVFSCCHGNTLVCGAVTQQWLLYCCLLHGHCLATGLHTTILQ